MSQITQKTNPDTHSENLKASEYIHLFAINEAPNRVLGNQLIALETYQDFSNNGVTVTGGTAHQRHWTDKNFVPITLKTQCVDCLHCVVACPHHSIGHEITGEQSPAALKKLQTLVNWLPGFNLDPETGTHKVKKSATNYNHCKGCFVCASACPTDAIHFVPAEFVDTKKYDGSPVSLENVGEIFMAPSQEGEAEIHSFIEKAKSGLGTHREAKSVSKAKVFNGSAMLADFISHAPFDDVSIFPITPNTLLLKILEDKIKHQDKQAKLPLTLRPCLSEESGYAWLTGSAVRGRRVLMAQGSQSLAQIYEFMNINPGLHLPIFMLELTRSLAPGTTTKPDHTTTFRTSDTGEIILFGRDLQDNYDKSLLLLKLMESEGLWIPGRLVIKGFMETHTLTSEKQGNLGTLSPEETQRFLGKPKNPHIFNDSENRSVGVLDMDSRYAEQRQAMDVTLMRANDQFDVVSNELSTFTGRPALHRVDRFPETGTLDVAVVGLNDPDMSAAEYTADKLREQGLNCGVVTISLFRPFPADLVKEYLKDCKAVAVVEYNNWSGRAGGGALAQEVRSALYDLPSSPKLISVQIGLGGRAVTLPYWLSIFRMLDDLNSNQSNSRILEWLDKNGNGNSYVLGTRGNAFPETESTLDIPLCEEGVRQYAVIGKGGQGLLQLNGLITGIASIRGEHALSMAGFGALQRGGGITLSIKMSPKKIRDGSDIILADVLVAFDGDISLDSMLPQLHPNGILILDGDRSLGESYANRLPPTNKVIAIPAKKISRRLYGIASRTNMILFGSLLAEMGISSEEEILTLLDLLPTIQGVEKEAVLVSSPLNRQAVLAGFLAYRNASGLETISVNGNTPPPVETIDSFITRIVPAHLREGSSGRIRFLEKLYALKKSLYQTMFFFHPMVNQIQSMYLRLNGETPITAGDMACAGCGQMNIFRTVFNFLDSLQRGKGKIYVSEQDGCGTVITSLNRTSIWNLPYIRIAFETAHGVAAGLAHDSKKGDIVVSISGDGGFMQGLRSVEDSLHQQDPILHIVVVNQTLGNTGGQATATTMMGATTREGHTSRREPLNFLKYAEKHHVQGAMASTVHLADLYGKIRWAHKVVSEQKRPFLLLMNFSCLEQGINLARSIGAQKMGLDAHFFNLYSLRYKDVRSSSGKLLYYKKRISIDWFPWTFGKTKWIQMLKEYYKVQKMMKKTADSPEALERDYWVLRGEWHQLVREMGWMRFYWAFFKNFFSLHRATMARLIKKEIPLEAKG